MKLKMTIHKIKCVEDLIIELPLEKGLYAITGQNGSGKSTIVACASSVFYNLYMNEHFGKAYAVNEMQEAITTSVTDFQRRSPWGYQLFYYIAADKILTIRIRLRAREHNHGKRRILFPYYFKERAVSRLKMSGVGRIMIIIHYKGRHFKAGDIFRHTPFALRTARKPEINMLARKAHRENIVIGVAGS